MNELAGHSLGGYRLEEELGRGSMGMVYLGKQIALGREVAVKVLPRSLVQDPSYVARFIREAQIIAGLNHPNIVQIYDAGQQNGVLYFVMEYIQGPTLGSLLHLDGTMPQHLAAQYAAQIADALDAAYKERNVIHRDIKPENLMLDRWGRIKVMDFGLARAPGLQQITVAKTLVGSIYYASPEQIWGRSLDNRSDVYALGVVLYEMVTGQRPFYGRTLQELTKAIGEGEFKSPSLINHELAPELEQIIRVALARDRDERYTQASYMAEDLRALQLDAPSVHHAQQSRPMPRLEAADIPRDLLPKRPQARRPHYPSMENTQVDLSAEVLERSSDGLSSADLGMQPSQLAYTLDDPQPTTSALTDAHQQDGHFSESLPPVAIPEQASGAPATGRQPRWKHLQRIFKHLSHEHI